MTHRLTHTHTHTYCCIYTPTNHRRNVGKLEIHRELRGCFNCSLFFGDIIHRTCRSHLFYLNKLSVSLYQEQITVVVEDLRLCTVKPYSEQDRRFCFEVVSPSKWVSLCVCTQICQNWNIMCMCIFEHATFFWFLCSCVCVLAVFRL